MHTRSAMAAVSLVPSIPPEMVFLVQHSFSPLSITLSFTVRLSLRLAMVEYYFLGRLAASHSANICAAC